MIHMWLHSSHIIVIDVRDCTYYIAYKAVAIYTYVVCINFVMCIV